MTIAPEVETALDARAGRELLHYTTSGPVLAGGARIELAASGGPAKILGMRVLKPGTFFGMGGAISIEAGDLAAMVDRFATLRDSDTFLPPFRLDHGWSVRDVIGWHDELRTELGIDDTTGEETTYLVADVTITGSVELTPAQIVDAIKRGALRNRSSELGGYRTNAGVELPLVYYGVAFVDIPAVEGLGPVPLRGRALGGRPSSVVELREDQDVTHDADAAAGDETTVETVTEETTTVATGDAATVDDDDPRDEVGDEDEVGGESGDDTGSAGSDDETSGTGDDETSSGNAPDAGARGSDEVSRLRAQLARERTERATTELAAFTDRGAVVPATRDAALALLSHEDDTVRTHVRTLLGNVRPPVELGRRSGVRTLRTGSSAGGTDASSGGGGAGPVIELGMTPDEVGDLWASLSTEERAARKGEYDAWSRDFYGRGR